MVGIKNSFKRPVSAPSSAMPSKKGNPREKIATGAHKGPGGPVLNHFEVRAKQLAKIALSVAAAATKAAKGNDKPGSPTGVYKPSPPTSGGSSFESCGPQVSIRPAVLTHASEGEVIPVKGNGGQGRGTVTQASYCPDEGAAPDTILV